nr:MAG TPA: hypothetical protein [Caudoviricetes sp.]
MSEAFNSSNTDCIRLKNISLVCIISPFLYQFR